ncbi:MAG TPA: P63C domain-containing protein [Sphingomicrobium sp.]|nr:P63C domain-containing protein [Sphingomicrobium sp.]
MTAKDPKKVAAGKARMMALTPAERREIGRLAAEARWSADLPMANYEGSFNIGPTELSAAVLQDERRIITQATFLRALGRSRSPKAGTGVLSTVDELPFFLQADALKPFVAGELVESSRPVFYRTKKGGKGVGYNALALKQVAETYLKFRDASMRASGRVPKRYEAMIEAADTLIRGLAEVGIVALVDEATGFQAVRQRHALQEILDAFLLKELAAWAKRFPDDFYQQIYRLRGWEWRGRKFNPPQAVAGYTKDFVYERLAPGIREELESRMPRDQAGRKRGRLHQLLTEDIGHPALAQHLHAVITLMKASKNWNQFKLMLDTALPKRGTTLQLPYVEDG